MAFLKLSAHQRGWPYLHIGRRFLRPGMERRHPRRVRAHETRVRSVRTGVGGDPDFSQPGCQSRSTRRPLQGRWVVGVQFHSGVTGVLYAYYFAVLSPEQFQFQQSVYVLAAVVVVGSVGPWLALGGAILVFAGPQLLRVGSSMTHLVMAPILVVAAALQVGRQPGREYPVPSQVPFVQYYRQLRTKGGLPYAPGGLSPRPRHGWRPGPARRYGAPSRRAMKRPSAEATTTPSGAVSRAERKRFRPTSLSTLPSKR